MKQMVLWQTELKGIFILAFFFFFPEGTLPHSVGSDEGFLCGRLHCGRSESGKWREGNDAEKFTPCP